MQCGASAPIYAIADEDLERSDGTKHLLYIFYDSILPKKLGTPCQVKIKFRLESNIHTTKSTTP